jgi:hypothetical protein
MLADAYRCWHDGSGIHAMASGASDSVTQGVYCELAPAAPISSLASRSASRLPIRTKAVFLLLMPRSGYAPAMSLLSRFFRGERLFVPKLEEPFSPETPLLRFSSSDPWTIRHAFEGCQIFGATGSGKTTGSGQAIAKAFLQAGFGGLVLTAKRDECANWQEYARDTGREESLIIFSPSNKWRFNFLNYELNRPGPGAGLTDNLVAIFANVLEVAERKEQGQGGGEGQFWRDALKDLLRNAIELLRFAKGTLTLEDIARIISTAPQSLDQVEDSSDWRRRSFCAECLKLAEERPKTEIEAKDFALTRQYWRFDFPNLAPKTRSIITTMFTNMASCFLRSPLRELFSTSTNFLPEHCFDGAVIILDLPQKEFLEVGRFAQALFKLMWQQAVERRDVKANPRPVFLWADESQYFINSYDMQFQTTARSSRAATVFLTQNISNYYAMLARQRAKPETDSLLGNLQLKVLHQNSDAETNWWAAELIGRNWIAKTSSNLSSSYNGQSGAQNMGIIAEGASQQASSGVSEVFEYEVPPREFTLLKKGGPENKGLVEAIIFQGGRQWKKSGKTFLIATFKQS